MHTSTRLVFLLFVPLSLLAVASPTAKAGYLTVANAGFESVTGLPDNGTSTSIPNWTRTGTASWTYNPPFYYFPGQAPEGQNVALLGTFNFITQTLSDTYQANTTYTLTVQVGKLVPLNNYTFAGYRIELLAGTTVIASDTNSFVPSDGTFQLATATYSPGTADPSLVGQTLRIRLRALGTGTYTAYDDVKLWAEPAALNPVPTPPAALLAGVGVACLGLARFRRRPPAVA